MIGIDLNKPVTYKYASFRFFEKCEHHITRFCGDNVLLMVFDGVLRFSENDKETEVKAGEYYIQKKNCHQAGRIASDAPKYLYVHFDAEWSDDETTLPRKGFFDFSLLHSIMEEIDSTSHRSHLFIEMQYLLTKLLLMLKAPPVINPQARILSEYVDKHLSSILSLSDLCNEFHYSKNYIIRLFNKEFGVSPVQYINNSRIKRAKYLLEATSKPIKEIATECGYTDYPYFYKRFVQKEKISPLEWRKQKQENPLA